METQFEVVAGSFGTGRGRVEGPTLRIAKAKVPLADIRSVDINSKVLQTDAVKAAWAGLKSAAGAAPAGLVAGFIVAPFAGLAVPAAITAAAVAGAIGALGGSLANRSLVHVTLRDGRSFVALFASDTATYLSSLVATARTIADARVIDAAPKSKPSSLLASARKTLGDASRATGERITRLLPGKKEDR